MYPWCEPPWCVVPSAFPANPRCTLFPLAGLRTSSGRHEMAWCTDRTGAAATTSERPTAESLASRAPRGSSRSGEPQSAPAMPARPVDGGSMTQSLQVLPQRW